MSVPPSVDHREQPETPHFSFKYTNFTVICSNMQGILYKVYGSILLLLLLPITEHLM